MPFKCSASGCRSNYDSTSEKVTVFQFPADDNLKTLWMKRLKIKKITISTRVCSKHFKTSDIDRSNQRCSLKPIAVPVELNVGQLTSEVVRELEDGEIVGFAQFIEGLEELQDRIVDNWNIYSQSNGVCLYWLSNSSHDELFHDINFSFKILINEQMKVKVVKNEKEASSKELSWLLQDSLLQRWSQLEELLEHYQFEPDIEVKTVASCSLRKALDILDQLKCDEIQDRINIITNQLVTLINERASFPIDVDHETYCTTDTCQQGDDIEDDYGETFEEFLDQDENDQVGEFHNETDTSAANLMEFLEPDEVIKNKHQGDSGEFKCDKCYMILLSEGGLHSHFKSCTAPRIEIHQRKSEHNVCDTCGKVFRTSKGLKEHMKTHDKMHRIQCSQCDAVLFSGTLQRHIKAVHNKIKPFTCLICSKAFSTPTLRNDHQKTHSKNQELQQYLTVIDGSPRYSCPKCSIHYDTSSLLKKHLEKNCSQFRKKRVYRYPCVACPRVFVTKLQTARHMANVHQIEISNVDKFCFECKGEFDDYVNHIRMHSCSFACSICGAKFLTQEKTAEHEQAKHAGETFEDRPFKCKENDCNLSFKNLNHLKSHQQAIHMTKQLNHKCPECEKTFSLKAHLTVHIRQHSSTFPCNYPDCNRIFRKLNSLKDHFEKVHAISEIYLCEFENCQERFKMLIQLKQHRQEEHGVAFNTHKYFETSQ